MNDKRIKRLALSIICRELDDTQGFVTIFLPLLILCFVIMWNIDWARQNNVAATLMSICLSAIIMKADHFRRALNAAKRLAIIKKSNFDIKENIVGDLIISGGTFVAGREVRLTEIIPHKCSIFFEAI